MTPDSWFDDRIDTIHRRVLRNGWTAVTVNDGPCLDEACPCSPSDEPAYTYTIGLVEYGHPELIVYGAPPPLTGGLLRSAYERHRQGRPLGLGVERAVELAGRTVAALPVDRSRWADERTSPLALWHRYYGPVSDGDDEVALVQLVVADRAGRFPWEPECSSALAIVQPVIGDVS